MPQLDKHGVGLGKYKKNSKIYSPNLGALTKSFKTLVAFANSGEKNASNNYWYIKNKFIYLLTTDSAATYSVAYKLSEKDYSVVWRVQLGFLAHNSRLFLDNNNNMLVFDEVNKKIVKLSNADGTVSSSTLGYAIALNGFAVSNDGLVIAITDGAAGKLKTYKTVDFSFIGEVAGSFGGAYYFDYHPDGKLLAIDYNYARAVTTTVGSAPTIAWSTDPNLGKDSVMGKINVGDTIYLRDVANTIIRCRSMANGVQLYSLGTTYGFNGDAAFYNTNGSYIMMPSSSTNEWYKMYYDLSSGMNILSTGGVFAQASAYNSYENLFYFVDSTQQVKDINLFTFASNNWGRPPGFTSTNTFMGMKIDSEGHAVILRGGSEAPALVKYEHYKLILG